ncbi:MAG: ABC transporter ATP-binding protein [Firmicutes bacterium]|nr:ABC transporter ATP-binding protein [Bacillota bacterium]
MIRISVHGVVCSYGCVPALEGVNFEVRRGDFTGIVGPNGSGKSTLLRTMSRVLRPTRGAVLLDGRDIYSQDPASVARRLAVVGQDPATEFGFSVLEVVLMGRLPHLGRFQRESAADVEIARKCLSLTGIAHLEHRRITETSSGERQRVLIARALAQEPQILLLDEPTSFLDIGYQADIMDLISSLNRNENLSVVVVMHDLNLAAQYCRSLILMKGGVVLDSGTPEDVLTPSNIRSAYGSEVLVVRHPVHARPHVIVLPKPSRGGDRTVRRARGGGRVHVVGGGAMGARLMDALWRNGFSLSTGVLNAGDGDWEKARSLGARIVEIPPFSPVTDADAARNSDLMKGASAVVLGNIPFGPGNLKNLETAVQAALSGTPLVVVEDVEVERRDYTGGRASALLSAFRERAASDPRIRVAWCRDDDSVIAAVEGFCVRAPREGAAPGGKANE